MKTLKFYFLFLGLSYILSSCVIQDTSKKTLNCPDNTAICMPMKWQGIKIDSSAEFMHVAGYRYKIQPVLNINTPDNEWAVYFNSSNTGILTYDDNSLQKIISVKRAVPERITIDKGFSLQNDSHLGFPSISSNLVAIAISENTISNNAIDDDSFGNQYIPIEKTIGLSKIYTGTYNDYQITNLMETDIKLDSDFFSWDSHPALSNDGKVMFFSSDREGGYGGTDIWYSVKFDTGDWSEPINCGDSINTACDEITPFISKNGKELFFSSKGHDNVGGFDIFKARIAEGFWKSPALIQNYFSNIKNLRAPLNTIYDEISPSCPTANCDSIFYYSTNQMVNSGSSISNSGGFDIFVMYKVWSSKSSDFVKKRQEEEINIDISDELVKDIKEPNIEPTVKVSGKVTDEEAQPIEGAKITVSKLPENRIELDTETNISGDYSFTANKGVEYEIKASQDQYFYDKADINIPLEDTSKVVIRNFILPKVAILRINFQYDKWDDPYRFTIDSNGVETGILWTKELDDISQDILNSIDKIKQINLAGHTDDVASVQYNYDLGLKRVNFVKDQLIKRGVPETIITIRSAGKLEPLPKRNNENIDLYRKRLRRVTLEKIMK